MKINYFDISGFDSLIRSFFMSNKNYSLTLELKLKGVESFLLWLKSQTSYGLFNVPHEHLDQYAATYLKSSISSMNTISLVEDVDWYCDIVLKAIKCGTKHTTLLRFVDFTFVVDGLHRGAQDDFDAHAKRLESRIVRMSTRTVHCEKINDVSDFYKGKIMTFNDLSKKFNLPETTEYNGETFVMTPFGYVRDDCKNDRDVLRGNVPLAVSSMFTVKVNMTEFCHIVRERAPGTPAAPELQEMIRMVVEDFIMPQLGEEFNLEWFNNNCLQ